MLLTYLLAKAVKEVNDDYRDELNSVNDDMEVLCERTNKRIERCQNRFEEAYSNLNQIKQSVFDSTFSDFAKVTKRLKNVDFENDFPEKYNGKIFENSWVSFKNNSTRSDKKMSTSMVIASAVMPGGMMTRGLFEGVSLQYKIDAARAERAELEAECEKAKIQCDKMNSMSRFCKNTTQTIDTLKELTDRAIAETKKIISEKGCDYKLYSIDEKNNLWVLYNFIFCLNDIVSNDIFTKKGEVKSSYKKFVSNAKDMLKECK